MNPPPSQNNAIRVMTATPRRISVTIPRCTYKALLQRSNDDGRSISNLAAFILESWLDGVVPPRSNKP